jgi:hypothetical protein
MADKEPTFTVTDRRKFTLDGDLRDGATAAEEATAESPAASNVVTMPARESREAETEAATSEAATSEAEAGEAEAGEAEAGETAEDAELPQVTAHESAEQDAAYQQSSRDLDDMLRQANPGMGPSGVVGFEHIIQSFYVSAMIAMGAGTEPGQKPRVDILGARQSIDMLALLQEKTKGNLTPKEESTLRNVLFELRMMFLEITNAIAQQSQRPADGKRP